MSPPPKMRLSSGYQLECPCGATIDSFGTVVCCMKCRGEITVVPPKAEAPARLAPDAFTAHQRAMWVKVRFS